MAYRIRFRDNRDGVTFDSKCGRKCAVADSGWFEQNEPIVVPESIDKFVRRYNMSDSEIWQEMILLFETKVYPYISDVWVSGSGSIMDWDGADAFGATLTMVGYSILIWDEIRKTVPGFDEAVMKVTHSETPLTSEVLWARFAATRSLVLDRMMAPGNINLDALVSALSEISTMYASIATFGVGAPGTSWDEIRTFGAFVHYLASAAQQAFGDRTDEIRLTAKNQEEVKKRVSQIVLVVDKVPNSMVKTGTEAAPDWDMFSSHEDSEDFDDTIKRMIGKLMNGEIKSDDSEEEDDDAPDFFDDESEEFWDSL